MKNHKLDITFIDFDDTKNPLLAGGQARATFEVARRLVALGNKVTVICSRFPRSRDGLNHGILFKHIGLGTGSIRLNNVVFFAALPLALIKHKADVIVECFTAPISTCFSPVFTKVPVIGMPTMFEAEEFSKKYHLPFARVESFGAKFYKYFLAYSQVNKNKMEKLNPKIVTRIIPNGVSEEAFVSKSKEGDYGLFLGRIDIFQKGLDLLLIAMSRLGNKTAVKIIIAGNGPKEEERKLLDVISKKKLSKFVKFVGRVDGVAKDKLIANSMFGIYPSRFEDFPLVPLEFAAFGKPLVCFDVPGLAWVSDEVSIKARPFEVDELSGAIQLMVGNKVLRSRLKKKAKPFARKYGWNNIAIKYQQFFEDILRWEKDELKGTAI